ncbi:MAG: GNAT family N-acetyltransferase [Aggregatilineales bacterium]
MTGTELRIAPVTVDHQSQWADLLALCFDRQSAHMHQLYSWLNGLYDLITWGAWDGEKLVAQYTCMMRPVSTPQGTVMAGMSINMAVHPEYRGRGLVKQVSAPVYEQVRACNGMLGVGFSNAEGVQVDRHSKSYGYQVVGRMQSSVFLVAGESAPPLTLQASFPDVPFRDMSSAHSRTHWQFPKSPDYLRKRYADHPFREYHYGIWQEDEMIRGLVIYRPVRVFGVAGVALLDVYGDDLPELLARWRASLTGARVRFVHVLGSPTMPLYQEFPARRWILPYLRTPYYLTVKPLADDLSVEALNLRAWDVIGGDVL